jgi:hypothetical protein
MNIVTKVRALMAISDMISEGEKETTMNGTVTPGYKTSEFWLHILSQVPAVLGMFLGASNPIVLAVAAAGALASAVYTVSRSGLKSTAITAAASNAASAAASALQQAVPPAPVAASVPSATPAS